jgi:1,2-diacylglycerol 3-alpha-glucosyltransferase
MSRAKVKVLLACSGLGHVRRGFEAATSEMAMALADKVDLTLARGGGPWFAEPGWRLPCLQRFGPVATAFGLEEATAYTWEQRSFALSLYAIALAGRYDIVQLHDPGLMNALWHARRRFGGRFVILFTNSGPIGPEHLLRADLVQSVTPVDASILEAAGFSPARIALAPYGIHPTAPPERRFDDNGPLRFIGIGALNDSQKGFATVIRAISKLPNTTLRLLGQRDRETPGLEALVRELMPGRGVLDTVPRDRIGTELAEADAFLLPSRNEGFCMAVLEAMDAGIPCVVSNIPVLKSLTGDAALQVPPDDPDDLISALAELGADRRRDLSRRGRERARFFHWPNLVEQYLSMYEAVMRAGVRSFR